MTRATHHLNRSVSYLLHRNNESHKQMLSNCIVQIDMLKRATVLSCRVFRDEEILVDLAEVNKNLSHHESDWTVQIPQHSDKFYVLIRTRIQLLGNQSPPYANPTMHLPIHQFTLPCNFLLHAFLYTFLHTILYTQPFTFLHTFLGTILGNLSFTLIKFVAFPSLHSNHSTPRTRYLGQFVLNRSSYHKSTKSSTAAITSFSHRSTRWISWF